MNWEPSGAFHFTYFRSHGGQGAREYDQTSGFGVAGITIRAIAETFEPRQMLGH